MPKVIRDNSCSMTGQHPQRIYLGRWFSKPMRSSCSRSVRQGVPNCEDQGHTMNSGIGSMTAGWRHPLIALILAILVSCSGQQTCTSGPVMTRQEAIDFAIRAASSAQPEISGALVEPRNPQAEQMTLLEATKRVTGNESLAPGEDPAVLVWVVTVEGLWADESPRPTGVPPPGPYHSYTIVLNACTREFILGSAHP